MTPSIEQQEDAPRQMAARQFKKILLLLAAPADAQIAENTDACVSCELLLDFEHWTNCYTKTYFPEQTTDTQRNALNAIKAIVEKIRASGEDECWTEDFVKTSPLWQELRLAAQRALGAFGWDG